jgi:hypothetical protein
MPRESAFSGDVMDVLGQLFEKGATALDDGDGDTAERILTSAETVATNKLPDGEFRSTLLDGCERALAALDDGSFDRAADRCTRMALEVDARR